MNIAELSSVAATPGITIACWILAAVVIIAAVVNLLVKRDETNVLILLGCIVCAGVICIVGWSEIDSASRDAKDKSFHQELKAKYGWETTASLPAVTSAASNGGTVTMATGSGSELIDVRANIVGDVLSFYSVSDNKLIKPAGS